MGVLTDELLAGLPADECERLYKSLRYRWPLWARRKQLPPTGEWDIWGLVGGRGVGKTRPGAEWTVDFGKAHPRGHFALVGRTARDTRDTMVLGESGIIAVSPPWFKPRYYPSRSLVRFPNDFVAHLYSAEEPDLLRGPQHHGAWGDEFAAWRKREAVTNLMDGLRLGDRPQTLFTTTPRRTPLFLDTFLGERPKDSKDRPISVQTVAGKDEWEFSVVSRDRYGREVNLRTVVRRMRSEENALNLPPGFVERRRTAYGGSSYGRMELDAEIQELVDGALWVLERSVDPYRIPGPGPQHFRRVVVIDPSHAADGAYDAAGIIVLGVGPSPDGKSDPTHGYVLADRTISGSPNAWGHAAVRAYDEFRADAIVYESNASPSKPDIVPGVIRSVDPRGRVKWFGVHSSRDKRTRADPVASLYEAGRVHHLELEDKPGHLAHLEHEMASWDPWDPKAKSPNRLDALVHGLTYLMLGSGNSAPVTPLAVGKRSSGWRP